MIEYRCTQCKGKNVERLSWVDVNTRAIRGHAEQAGNVWCRDCEDHVELVSRHVGGQKSSDAIAREVVEELQLRTTLWPEFVAICHAVGVTPFHAAGKVRTAGAVRARHRLWLLAYDRYHMSYPEIGRLFQVDRSTVLTAVHKLRREAAEAAEAAEEAA